MKFFSSSFARSILPLMLIFSIVLVGLSLILVRQKNYFSYEKEMDLQVKNIAAKKDLRALVVADLQEIAKDFYLLLISKDQDYQQNLLDDARLTIAETHAALNTLSAGGTLSFELPLNLPTQNTSSVSVSFFPTNRQHYNLEVLTLRPQLVTLEEKLLQTVDMTSVRNRLLVNPEGDLLNVTGLQLRTYAKSVRSLLERMTENANRLAYDARLELLSSQSEIAITREKNRRIEFFWAIATIFCVLGLIGVIYRQILAAHNRLEDNIDRLQQTEDKLQKSHTEVLTLNQSLEDQVAIRTQELAASERLWADAFDSVTFPIFLHNQKGRIIKANRAYLLLAECSLEHAFGKYYWDIFPQREGALPGCLESIQSESTECRVVAQNVWVGDKVFNSHSFPVYADQGEYLYSVHYMEDVTEREGRIEKLRRFEEILSTSTDLISFYNRDHIYLAVNDVYADYFGMSVDSIIGRRAIDVIGSEHYECHIREYLDCCLAGEEQSFRVWVDSTRKGQCYLEVLLTPYVDDKGQTTGLVSRCRDITENQEQESRLKLAAEVFESTTEGITITDKNGSIVAVNPAFTTITGYTEAEVLGGNPRILKSDRHDNIFYQEMWRALDERGRWRGEIWNKNKKGDVYPELLTISSIQNDKGDTENYVAVFSDISSIKKVAEQLEYQAQHHPLTGLPNRLLLHARLQHSIQNAKRQKQHGAVMFLDLDNFKKINDSLGHSAGDEVLKEVALRLQEHSREVDTVSHLSGDEFVIVMQSIRTGHDAAARAQQILDSLQKPFMVGEYELYISGSIGIVEFSGEGVEIESLLKNADSAMYKAKEGGKNSYQFYSSDLTEDAIERVLLETHLRRVLEQNELVLYYQPQVALPGGNIVAAEALVRWQHPELGLIPPEDFIPLSEEMGLIVPMGEWILRTACEQLMLWRKQGCGLRRIAVNLSGKQIQQKNLLEVVERVLLETGCPSGSLELEISEGFIMQHPEQSISVLQQIRALGVELSVDDFGTGHSSLNYLKRLPINRLKIDRTFVWDIGENTDGETITKAIIAMGQSLNLQITAEGIETSEQREFLESLGCNEAQGYLFSRPVPAEDISKLLKRSILSPG